MMAFRLARDVGEWDVDAMLERMPAPLFSQWCEFYAREPASEAFYLAFAILGKRIAELLGAKNVKIEAFMPQFGRDDKAKKEMSSEDMETVFRAMALAHNESIKNG